MTETFDIAGYARISVDDELDQKNISIENQKAICELGSFTTDIITSRARMIGIVIGVCNCCASWMLSTAEPTAANIAE